MKKRVFFLRLFAIICTALTAIMIALTLSNEAPPMGFVVAGFLALLGISATEALSFNKYQKVFCFLMFVEFLTIIILLLR